MASQGTYMRSYRAVGESSRDFDMPRKTTKLDSPLTEPELIWLLNSAPSTAMWTYLLSPS